MDVKGFRAGRASYPIARLESLSQPGHPPERTHSYHVEFERRKSVEFAGVSTWITSREDLILSKLVWASDSGSEMQLRDVRTLIDESVDWPYLKDWAAKLGVAAKLDEVSK